MKLLVSFNNEPCELKNVDKSDVECLANKYSCTISMSNDTFIDTWCSRYNATIDCPDNTSINNIVKDLYSLFGGDSWHISVDINDPDKLIQTTEDSDEKDCLTVETISCHGTVGPLQDDLKFLSKELKKYYDPSSVVKIEGSRQVPINTMVDKPQTNLNYNIFIEY